MPSPTMYLTFGSLFIPLFFLYLLVDYFCTLSQVVRRYAIWILVSTAVLDWLRFNGVDVLGVCYALPLQVRLRRPILAPPA